LPEISSVLPHLVHAGAILYLVCFLFRNQVILRCFAIMGDCAYMAYYYGVSDRPLWDAMFYASMNIIINFAMIMLVLRDRQEGSFNVEDLHMYRRFSPLSPGEFRRLMKLGKIQVAEAATQLTEEGKALDRLYYVMEGDIDIKKSGRKIKPDSGIFIGEVAFLSQVPATATVKISKGTRLVVWDSTVLKTALSKDTSLGHGFQSLLNADLVAKVARS
jgi:Popeye protein conserved region